MGCASSGPEQVVTDFYKALQHQDFDKAKKYATASSLPTLDMMAGFYNRVPAELKAKTVVSPRPFRVAGIKINGNNATATLERENDTPLTINMKKENGQWKADYPMQLN